MSDTPFIISIDTAKAAARIELNRPDKGNRLSAPEVATLGRAIREAGARKDVKAVLVGAKGDAFCLGRAPGGAPPANAVGFRSELADNLLSLYADVRGCEVPVIAVVQGPALGFGSAFAAVADLAIAADTARFAFPEMDHNLPPTLAMSAALGKIPPKRLLHMVYSRAQIDAHEALALGLVSQVCPRAKLAETAEATLAWLSDRDRAAVSACKEYLLNAAHLDAQSSARLGANIISVVLSSQKH